MRGDAHFHVGIEFDSVLAAISKQIYETPLAFIRENVQNAVDALRMQAARDNLPPSDPAYSVRVSIDGGLCEIHDNGIGMSLDDLRDLFWTIGASGKRTSEARAVGCVGMFGIGGFANFGVCDDLVVISPSSTDGMGHATRLSSEMIEAESHGVPQVEVSKSAAAGPRGTIVRGTLRETPDLGAVRAYLRDFVQYAEERVFFDDVLISGGTLPLPSQRAAELVEGRTDTTTWSHSNVTVSGKLFETPRHILHAELSELVCSGEPVRLVAALRFENGPIDILKRGFKLCTASVGTQIGVSGVIDCDRLAPTAGRDSLDAESSSLVSSIVASMERAAVLAVLDSSDRIAQHTRIFKEDCGIGCYR